MHMSRYQMRSPDVGVFGLPRRDAPWPAEGTVGSVITPPQDRRASRTAERSSFPESNAPATGTSRAPRERPAYFSESMVSLNVALGRIAADARVLSGE